MEARNQYAKKEELVVSVKDDIPNLPIDPPSQPAPASKVNLESGNDLEELELEQAVIKVQAAFIAHQARRAFRTLKGIIRPHALIRGHLVRRQAVATYSCIWGIVKFHELVRGHKVRSLDNGTQFPRTHMEAGDSEALQLRTYSWMDDPPKFFIVDKILASSPNSYIEVLNLHVQELISKIPTSLASVVSYPTGFAEDFTKQRKEADRERRQCCTQQL